MSKQNKLYKFLRIIFLTLAIILAVFSLLKKVGLAADSGNSGFSLPYYTGNKTIPHYVDLDIIEGYVKSSSGVTDWENTTYKIIARYSEDNNEAYYDYYIFYGVSQDFYITTSDYSVPITPGQANSVNSDNNRIYLQTKGANSIERYRVTYNMQTQQITNNGRASVFSVWTLPTPNTSFIFYYANADIKYTSQDIFSDIPSPAANALIFAKGVPSPPHSKGGVLTDFSDSTLEFINSDTDPVDTSAPSDPNVNSGWFQKILNGISNLKNIIGGGFLNFQNNLQSFFMPYLDFFIEDFDESSFSDQFNSIPIIADFNNLSDLIDDSGMFDWSDVTPAQRVSFTVDFGGSVLPHTSTEINFDWYNGTIKTVILSLISTFLVLGLFVTIINQLPNIIGGKSGDRGGGSDS